MESTLVETKTVALATVGSLAQTRDTKVAHRRERRIVRASLKKDE